MNEEQICSYHYYGACSKSIDYICPCAVRIQNLVKDITICTKYDEICEYFRYGACSKPIDHVCLSAVSIQNPVKDVIVCTKYDDGEYDE